jgi:hypothetical protein
MKLKTHHGTFVVEGEDGELIHLPEPLDVDLQSAWLQEPPQVSTSGVRKVAITKGSLAPSTLVVLPDGLVAFRRGQLYLCADPRFPELSFNREKVGPWETFALTDLAGNVIVQPLARETIRAGLQPEFEIYDIDLINAYRPSGGQLPVTFSDGSFSGSKPISYLYVEPYGRFGNNIYQIINSYWIARVLSVSSVILNDFDFINENVSSGVEIKPDNNSQIFPMSGLRGHFFAPNGFEPIFTTKMRSNEALVCISNMLKATYKKIIDKSNRKNSIAMHFRSGDIFGAEPHSFYVQPPVSYYLKCFDHAIKDKIYDSVDLIYEDRQNPAIEAVEEALAKRGVSFTSCATTLSGDISRLLSADCIISSFGSFCEGAAWLSKNLKNYYCFRGPITQDIFQPFSQSWLLDFLSAMNIGVYICDDPHLNYIKPRTWTASLDQREAIKSFPADFIRLFKYN